MTKRSRTILFYSSLFLFLLIAPLSVLYSQGYRFNFAKMQIIQTGGIFVKATPKQAKVFIDEKLTKKTDFLAGSALISNLLPQKYAIRVEKEGYHIWEKTLEVTEKEVTEIKSLVLFPQDPGFSLLTEDIEDFWMSPDGKKIILKEVKENNWALKLYGLQNNVKSALIEETDINPKGAELLNLEFADSQNQALISVSMREQVKNFSLDFEKTPPLLTESTTSVATTTPQHVLSFQKINNDVYFLDNSGIVFKSDPSFTPQEKINLVPFPIKQETEYELKIFKNSIFILEDKTLYLFNYESKFFEKFFEPLSNLKLSPDSKKVVYLSENEIWILFLEDINAMPQRKTGEKVFLTRFSEKIDDVFWLNSDYLVFNSGDRIQISEIDDRDKINIYDLGEFQNPKIFWNQVDKKLYILSSGNLFASQDLLQ